MKIVTIVGARPQFIKAAMLSRSIRNNPALQEVMIHTGQHFDANMSDIFFQQLGIPLPQYNLEINGLGHAAMTGRMMEKIEEILVSEKPVVVVVFGDTNSTMAGALAAKKLKIPVAHIEAGLRSFDMTMPEEINRVVTDKISDLLFCPTETAMQNLSAEGIPNTHASKFLVGDIMYDCSLYFAEQVNNAPLPFQPPYVICTLHRQEIIESLDGLKNTLDALSSLHKEIPVVLVTHPRTNEAIEAICYHLPFHVSAPLGYFDMLQAVKNAECVITDSGGLQKEAYFLKKPCITLRKHTEWKELVEAGVNVLAVEPDKVIPLYHAFIGKKLNFNACFFGDGQAADKIVDQLITHYKGG
jgi:UDP-GlcNAc3NAcA epimerase